MHSLMRFKTFSCQRRPEPPSCARSQWQPSWSPRGAAPTARTAYASSSPTSPASGAPASTSAPSGRFDGQYNYCKFFNPYTQLCESRIFPQVPRHRVEELPHLRVWRCGILGRLRPRPGATSCPQDCREVWWAVVKKDVITLTVYGVDFQHLSLLWVLRRGERQVLECTVVLFMDCNGDHSWKCWDEQFMDFHHLSLPT